MDNTSKKICVFCGASKGTQSIYSTMARKLASIFLEQNITLVYGGAKVGLMGEMAEAIMEGGGRVTGIIPSFLRDKEIANTQITDLQVVDTMSERKKRLIEISDGFILLPGGIGSLDEFFEVLTLAQLGQHNKPSGILNVGHYYDDLLKFLAHSVNETFWNLTNHNRVIIEEDPQRLMDKVLDYHVSLTNRWSEISEPTKEAISG
jgi:uncharacterized protein (TIGR00730 family)